LSGHYTYSRSQIAEMAAHWMPENWNPDNLCIHTDSSDFFNVTYGDIFLLPGMPLLIRNNAREGRFGLEDEVKHWVKRAIELPDGNMRIVKLVFYEKFTTRIGGISFECFRSPRKEARILELVKEHPNFMHGVSIDDPAGNPVRVLEYISGRTLPDHIVNIDQNHETYFHETLPSILNNFLQCIRAIRFLHENGEKHGDIRRDHILIDKVDLQYRWIDFDYNYRHRESMFSYDLFGLGNILIYIVGKGDILVPDLRRKHPDVLARLKEADMNIVFRNRLADLQKMYPYIPESLNLVMLHFSSGANWYYEHADQLIQDLEEALDHMGN
jgi:hypothetical protein